MTPTPPPLALPSKFLWGVSTAAFQIEGGAAEDGRGPSIWDTHGKMKGRIANGDTGDVACDHYHRWAEDVALMKELGIGAYRFSVSWPRVLPRGRGAVNEAGLAFYDRLIDALLEAGIEPWLCLYHWDLPQGLQDLGGWGGRDSAGWFADYAALCARRYGDRVKRWATFNEPSVFSLFGYGFNWNAPGIADRAMLMRVIHHVNLAHGAAIDVLRASVEGASLGIVHNRQPCPPDGGPDGAKMEENRPAAAMMDAVWNLAFPEPQIIGAYPALLAEEIEPYVQAGDLARICRPLDWFGLNHYSPIYVRKDEASPVGFSWGGPAEDAPRSDLGWEIAPDAFRDVLVEASRRYKLPVYVTENGFGSDKDAPDANGVVDDPRRVAYLDAYTRALAEAVRLGADVRGYFVWSLLDNLEWGAGYTPRFGLVHVDYPTQKRTIKTSGRWFAERIGASAG